MSSAVGLRDQRLRVYARSDSGAHGFVRPVFTFQATWWGRLDESAVAVRGIADKLQMKLDALVECADEASLPIGGLLQDPDGVYWWIRGINSNRLLRRLFVGVERIAEEQVATFTVYEGADTLDGVHVVEPTTIVP